MATIPLLTLNTGAKIPAVGLGTWQSPKGEVKAAVLHALKSGYRHIDCAFMYQNEAEVGEAFKEAFDSGVCRREDVFVTTKLWCTYHRKVQECLNLSLGRLGLDYVDAYLVGSISWISQADISYTVLDALARTYESSWPAPSHTQAQGWLP